MAGKRIPNPNNSNQARKPGSRRNARTGPARAPRGAKLRATTALVGKKFAKNLSQAELYAFWSAASQKIPPPLKTSFGNYTCVNSVVAFTVTTSTTVDTVIWVPWTASGIAALQMQGVSAAAITQYVYGPLISGGPLQLRPLRSSFTVESITQMVNTAGSIRVLSYDNALNFQVNLGVSSSSNTAFTSPASLIDLVNGSPDTEEFTLASLIKEHEFVSVPASYPGYNSYYDVIPLQNTNNSGTLINYDANQLLVGDNRAYPVLTAITTVNSVQLSESGGALGGLPPMRGFIMVVPPTPSAQTLRFRLHRQDGVRYPVNTLGHTFAHSPSKMSSQGEDSFLQQVANVTQAPARAVAREAVASATAAASRYAASLISSITSGAAVRYAGQALMNSAKAAPLAITYL